VLAYLARYTHRVAISNSRLISLDDHAVRFRWKDYRTADPATGAAKIKTMALSPDEFLRRFLLHVLPAGFHRIRHYGLLAKGPRAIGVDRLRALIAAQAGAAAAPPCAEAAEPAEPETTTLPACRCCGGRLRIIEVFRRGYARGPPSPSASGWTAHEPGSTDLDAAPPSRHRHGAGEDALIAAVTRRACQLSAPALGSARPATAQITAGRRLRPPQRPTRKPSRGWRQSKSP
jgi:hypothetical protein